jgi:hypothetical protein
MMSRKYLLIPVLVTLLVLTVSLYPVANVNQRASAAPRAAVVTKFLMIPAAAFNARYDSTDYYNYGYAVALSSGTGGFVAPVYLPPGARIRMIKLFAYDINPSSDICVSLHEIHPKTGGGEQFGQTACTTGSGGHQEPTKYLSHFVRWYYGYYVWLEYQGSNNLFTYGVILKYTVNQ